ncbi:hypothetical protein ACFFQW_46415 [Umezawaea endophytica]|uniref:Terpene synthase n=1 Tax=Umezawaea endophytica TaxID=1654476 RepID=A0A9X2VXY5_9PSEU|nr:hypothetical protein [Umezawaea endophytica]MCS7483773.1 hypothetical protein [Umezawaea endophytica]
MTAVRTAAPEVPPLYCPLPSAVHPLAADIGRRSIAWLDELGVLEQEGLRENLIRTRAAEWACRIAPFGNEERLQIVSDWTHLGFAIDDCRFDAGALVGQPEVLIPLMMRLMPNLDHPEVAADDPFSAGFRDLSARARAAAPAAVVRRWVEGNMEWFFAVACLTSYRVSGSMPSLADYVNLGPRDRAMRLTGSLIEIAEGTYLPDEDRERPEVRAATQAANMLVTIGNDLYSLSKETEHDVLESNIVGVIAHEDGCDAPEAVRRTVALHDRIMCRYLRLRRGIEARGSEPVRRHLSQLDHLVRGNLEWSAHVPRYRGAEHGERTSSPWADVPSDAEPTAPPIPGIAWWWDEVE